MAAATAGCSELITKLAPFMDERAPAANIFELLAPLFWLMDGKPLSQYVVSEFWPILGSYISSNGRVPIACVGALCALVLLSLLVFVMWRCVRCVRVVCCQQERYGDASKVLFGKRLKAAKALAVVIGLLACGAAAWGMISLNKDVLPSLNARIDSMQELPARVVAQVQGLANETASLSQPLANMSAIIRGVDVDGLRADLASVAAFLSAAPHPGLLRRTLGELSTALKPRLYDGLRSLHADLSTASDAAPLSTLRGHLQALAAFDIRPMAPPIRDYSDAIRTLVGMLRDEEWTHFEIQASRQFAHLRSAYHAVDLDAWVPYVQQALASANAINAMRTPATNPFTVALSHLALVSDTIKAIRGEHLASLAHTVERFNGLWLHNASDAFQSLLARAAHINHTVLELPRDVESKVRLVNASLADFNKLYAAHGSTSSGSSSSSDATSLATLPARIESAGAKLAMPDASALIADLKQAEAALNAAPGLDALIDKLASLAAALDRALRDAKNSIQPSLDAFARDETARDDLLDTLRYEGPVVEGSARVVAAAAAALQFAEPLKPVLAALDSTAAAAAAEVGAIPGVLQQISQFDGISDYLAPLQQAEAVYAQFSGNPANLTRPVNELLDRVSDILHTELADAQTLVTNVSTSVMRMSDSIQAAALDGIDSFQAAYLGTSGRTGGSSGSGGGNASVALASSTKAAATLQHAVHGAYYATLGIYALIIGLLLLLFLVALLNCPAGLCAAGFLLHVALVLFAVLPLLLSLGLLVMRDTCGNLETLANNAVVARAGNDSLPAALSQYYLAAPPGLGASGASLPDVLRDVSEDLDVQEIRERVQQAVQDKLAGITKDYKLRPVVSRVIDDATSRISDLMGRVDAVLLTLDHDHVAAVYQQGKSFFCCGLVQQVYVQWAATLMVLALSWVALQCAMVVLMRLDTLSESCCRFRRYRSGDYGGASEPGRRPILGLPPHKPLQSTDSAGSETVAVISLGGAGGPGAKVQEAKDGAELLKATPLPGPLAPTQQRIVRRIYPAAPSQRSSGGGGGASAPAQAAATEPLQEQQHSPQVQRLRVAAPRSPAHSTPSLYPPVVPALPHSPAAASAEQQQVWGHQSQGSWQSRI